MSRKKVSNKKTYLTPLKAKRVNIDLIKKTIESSGEGYSVISQYEAKAITPILLKCNLNHEYVSNWNRYQQGQRCPTCNKPKKRTFEELQEKAKKNNFIIYLKEEGYLNTKQFIKIECSKKHFFEIKAGSFLNGKGECPYCEGLSVTSEDVIKLLRSKGYEPGVNFKYVNCKTKFHAVCPKHGDFFTSKNKLHSHYGCNKCGSDSCSEKLRADKDFVFNEIRKSGFEVLQDHYISYRHKIKVKCPNDHIVFKNFASFVRRKKGCQICAKNYTLDGKDLKERIERDAPDYKFLYRKNKRIYLECASGHKYNTLLNNFTNGHRCGKCKNSKHEKECRNVLEKITGLNFPSARPSFLKNEKTKNNLEIDCYNEEINLGLEYNGEQHYLPMSHWGGNQALQKTQERDTLKLEMCKKNNTKLIIVPYTVLNKENFILEQLIDLGFRDIIKENHVR